jgi:hypothetical protein
VTNVTIKSSASPTCVLLAFDWPDGEQSRLRDSPQPGLGRNPNFLANKLDLTSIAPNAKPKPSGEAANPEIQLAGQ